MVKLLIDILHALDQLEKEERNLGMTDQLRLELEDRLEKAESSGDQHRINEARRAIDHHTLECQAHTADRIKRIESDVTTIKATVIKISENQNKLEAKHHRTATDFYATQKELQSLKDQASGAKKGIMGLWDVLKWVAAAGGGGLILKLLGQIN